ncbi:RNA polymerase sigma-70 factor, ECF subfamily [Terriglobus roseus]|uniref:RNA polymerase sigma-70 factor, ECF subfamily n=2 Tax=Terriglobus roseus TaxID=392734 RepID=A0A1H4M7Y6_9BACT|nr:RNA polymerase sigma-70 factor, ECF subfamily [Terriglobus roseus]
MLLILSMAGLSNPISLFRTAAQSAPGVEAVSSQDTAALQAEVLALFDDLRDRLLRYSLSFGIARHDAEDVLQECFLALFRHLQAGRSRENLSGWAFRTTHNLSLKRRASVHAEYRAAVPEETAQIQVCDDGPGPEEHVLFSERQERLRAVVRALPETDQMCLRLRADGMRYREIAGTLGISLGSVAASLARSFERLQRMDAR